MTYYGNDERHFQTVVLEKCSSYNNLSIESHESVYADRIKDRLLGTLANMILLYSTALYIAVPSEYALVGGASPTSILHYLYRLDGCEIQESFTLIAPFLGLVSCF